MKPIFKKRCIIGEGPIYRESDGRLYFVNPVEAKEICSVRADGGDVSAFVKSMNGALHGRGGGRNGFAQGSVETTKTEIETFFEN